MSPKQVQQPACLVYGSEHVPKSIIYAATSLRLKMLTTEVSGNQEPVFTDAGNTFIGEEVILRHLYESELKDEGHSEWFKFVMDRVLPLYERPAGNMEIPLAKDTLEVLDKHLRFREYVFGYTCSVCDLVIYEVLEHIGTKFYQSMNSLKRYMDLLPFHNFYKPCQVFVTLTTKKRLEKEAAEKKEAEEKSEKAEPVKGKEEEEESTHELPGAVYGQVVTRFPPEPSGYLHIGHAKAALLNQHFARKYGGKLLFRFDDTNPSKETDDFMESIEKDLAALEIKPDQRSYTSDHFETIMNFCTQLIKEGKAYCDTSSAEEIKESRGAKKHTPAFDNSIEENLRLWKEMQEGTELGKSTCVRAKIDISSEIGCMRDPVIYRCPGKPHLRTGNRYKAYPTYDLACPIVDSIEGVTHALRSVEFTDRDSVYSWVCENLHIRRPYVGYFSRLNMRYTVMSKRKLQWFVDQGIVDGWTDPRFPTIQGIRRRGMTIKALQEFVVLQGLNKNTNFMEWGKLWAINRGIIDDAAPRYTEIITERSCKLTLKGVEPHSIEIPLHKKNDTLGKKTIGITNEVYIERGDSASFKEDEMVTLMNIGNFKISNIVKCEKDTDTHKAGDVISAEAQFLEGNTDFKKTRKLTWVPTDNSETVPVVIKYFDNLVTVPQIMNDTDVTKVINTHSESSFVARAEKALEALKPGAIIQFERTGYFYYDRDEVDKDGTVVRVFHNTPDGRATPMRLTV